MNKIKLPIYAIIGSSREELCATLITKLNIKGQHVIHRLDDKTADNVFVQLKPNDVVVCEPKHISRLAETFAVAVLMAQKDIPLHEQDKEYIEVDNKYQIIAIKDKEVVS